MDIPWLGLGDFNLIIKVSEKECGRKYSAAKRRILNSFLDKVRGVDVGST